VLQKIQEKWAPLQKVSKAMIAQELQQTLATTEVYRHESMVLIQDDTEECFSLSWGERIYHFKICDLIKFRRAIFSIDLVALCDSKHGGVELVRVPHLDSHFVLSLRDILVFRELLSGGFTMLQLNSMVSRALVSPF
jgi:hypothetical protein